MSAIEWLPFITPLVWILLILNVLALFPIQLKQRLPFRVKFTIFFLVVDLAGWLLALLAIHIMTPVIRVNVLALSQVVLTPTLIVLGVVLVCRLIQGKNFLTTMLKGIGCFLKPTFDFLVLAAPTILHILSNIFSVDADEEEKRQKEKQEQLDKIHINWKGEYSGQDDWNKY